MARKGKMIVEQIESEFLQQSMELKIYQPETFSPLYKYHLCIMQDGNDYYQMGRIATLSDQLHDDFEIENTVFVGIHYKDRYDRLKKYHPDGEQNEAYTKFLIREVVPFLDDLLPTYNMGGARTLMGDSLAGTLALMTALKYPNTFGKVIMQSPLVNDTVLNAVNEAKRLDTIDIYHTIGTNELSVETSMEPDVDFVTPNRQLRDLLETKGLTYTYKEIENGEHTWKYWQKDMPNALKTMFGDD
ncbi:alpha/beta hydrolase [Ornithinibacillus halophilus]|uniref:Enterochelin esterase n=1 Tax=Ornithinibacillus halophilus TaxID=930117 RepID=A0A1M5IQ11_9BACI|nr:alpha/beta hydrolase-fold protein [Ornithinibacillus halophilus]SHG30341.1 Enterochelin esterase [Ornithinibacillus halophilus]